MTRNLLVLALLAVGLAGCEFDQPCDKGQEYRAYVCYDVVPDAGPQADADPGVQSQLGATCAVPADCTNDTDYCAISPGDPTGYCTRTGCLADPTRCPDGWSCLDLAQFSPGLPAICTAP